MDSKKIVILFFVFAALSIFVLFQPQITGFISRTGQLSVGNAAPAVENVFMNTELITTTAGDTTINPNQEDNRTVTVKVQISDTNGNCDLFASDNVTVYLCDGLGACNSGTADYAVNLSYDVTDGQWGASNEYCNMTGDNILIPFFDVNGTWRTNVSVTDGALTGYGDNYLWTYGELAAFTYASSTVNMGAATLGAWNEGRGNPNTTKNVGNIILDLNWNATNFTGTSHSEIIPIASSNFMIDDDLNRADGDSGNVAEAAVDYTGNTAFQPANGLLLCTTEACSNDNSTMNVYWHINVPAGLSEDTYENTIYVTSAYH